MKKNSLKNVRINAEVQRALSDIIRNEIKDPRVQLMTTVTDVYVTPDLKYCTVYVSILGNEKEVEDTIKGLKSASGFIRKQLASEVNLRNTPELKFEVDNSLEYGMKMSKLIDEVVGKDNRESKE
jgi:ribosome-binding factor A